MGLFNIINKIFSDDSLKDEGMINNTMKNELLKGMSYQMKASPSVEHLEILVAEDMVEREIDLNSDSDDDNDGRPIVILE